MRRTLRAPLGASQAMLMRCVSRIGRRRFLRAPAGGTIIINHDYSVAAHGDVTYAAHIGGIDMMTGHETTPLPIPDLGPHQSGTLSAGTDGVWSFAGQTIGILTDTGWHTVLSRPAPSS